MVPAHISVKAKIGAGASALLSRNQLRIFYGGLSSSLLRFNIGHIYLPKKK